MLINHAPENGRFVKSGLSRKCQAGNPGKNSAECRYYTPQKIKISPGDINNNAVNYWCPNAMWLDFGAFIDLSFKGGRRESRHTGREPRSCLVPPPSLQSDQIGAKFITYVGRQFMKRKLRQSGNSASLPSSKFRLGKVQLSTWTILNFLACSLLLQLSIEFTHMEYGMKKKTCICICICSPQIMNRITYNPNTQTTGTTISRFRAQDGVTTFSIKWPEVANDETKEGGTV